MSRSLSLLYTLGWLIGWLALAALISALVATGFGEIQAFTAFLNTAGFSLFVAIALIFAFRDQTAHTYRRRHGLVLIGLAWIILPVFASLPFISLMDLHSIDGYFEAVSMFTTTGASIAPSVDDLPRSLIFWRSVLQWMGGALTIVFAAAALERSNASAGQGHGVRLLSGALASRERLAAMARQVMPLYVLLTALCFLALWLTGVATFEAVALSLSILSTGGAAVSDAMIADFGGVATALVFMVFMGLGAVNLLTLTTWVERRRLRAGLITLKPFAVVIALVMVVFMISAVMLGSGQGISAGRALVGSAFSAVSLFSTTGYVYDATVIGLLPLPFVITLVLIGGTYGSTAGGMKIGRVAQMIGDSTRELEHLIHPNAVVVEAEGAGGFEPNRVIWSYLAAYLMGMVLIAGLLSSGGMGFDSALAGAAAMLANVGPLFNLANDVSSQGVVTLSGLPHGVLLGLSAAMVLGRIEILAALSILIPIFWTR